MPQLRFGISVFIPRHSYFARTSTIWRKISSVTAPLLIVSGTADTLTPIWMAEKIFAQAHQPKQLYLVPGAGHNDLLITGGDALTLALQMFIHKER